MELVAPVAARVADLPVVAGQLVVEGDILALLEVMKMEHPVLAPSSGSVRRLHVEVGDTVEPGQVLVALDPSAAPGDGEEGDVEPGGELLDQVRRRHGLGRDEARPTAVESRRRRGHRTIRENIADLCTDFVEYGPLAIAAQRSRRDLDDLMRATPAEGMVAGIGRVPAHAGSTDDRLALIGYDYTVLAGTQGFQNHRKKDRIFALAAEMDLPTVLFAEGGGGRPGDVDWPGVSMLEVRAFRLFGQITAPTIGVTTGYCFAGNAALLGQCDVIVATSDSNLGMGGPAMIEGGGLGTFAPGEVGPAATQAANGVIDVVVDDDPSAVEVVRRLLGLVRGPGRPGTAPEVDKARQVVPENRRRLFDMRRVIASVVDSDSFLELRAAFAPAAITGFGRVEGYPVGIIANDPGHLAGAIDHHAAVSLERHLRLCERWRIPVLSLVDTPGFMVGPEAEAEGLVRSAGSLFRTVAGLEVPVGAVVVRRAYGLGAMAMAGGGFHEGRFVVGWPTSELGPMGLEGAVRLGFKRELEAFEDPDAQEAEVERRVAEMLEVGRGINVATHFEIDDVIDPADTRAWILTCLT
ncbi:MAG TPA: carboxyl transferase domain-containing protein [Acidimicrobiia bacterium]|nr:carboxyl transferase domain-containing protein [Acidimicrobiia bacterium]